jgi:hypothetical protein
MLAMENNHSKTVDINPKAMVWAPLALSLIQPLNQVLTLTLSLMKTKEAMPNLNNSLNISKRREPIRKSNLSKGSHQPEVALIENSNHHLKKSMWIRKKKGDRKSANRSAS